METLALAMHVRDATGWRPEAAADDVTHTAGDEPGTGPLIGQVQSGSIRRPGSGAACGLGCTDEGRPGKDCRRCYGKIAGSRCVYCERYR